MAKKEDSIDEIVDKVLPSTLKLSGINWNKEVPKTERLIIFNDKNTVFKMKILSCKGFSTVKINEKDVKQLTFEVVDLSEEEVKLWNIVSKTLMNTLKELEPLLGKNLLVRKSGSGFEITYSVKVID